MSTMMRKRTSMTSPERGGSRHGRPGDDGDEPVSIRSRFLKSRPRVATWFGLAALVFLVLKVNLFFQAHLLNGSGAADAEQSELDHPFVPDTRPYFILHVGPSKTATTTLQATSILYKEDLAKDDYVFVGRADGFENTKFKELVSQECVLKVQEIGEAATCWKELKAEMDKYASSKKHLIFSDEVCSSRRRYLGVSPDSLLAQMVRVLSKPVHTKLHQAAGRDLLFWQLFRTAITQRFQVQLHLTYRRYSEWLVSLKAWEDLEIIHNHQDQPLSNIVAHKERSPYNDIWAQTHLYRMIHGVYSPHVHTAKSLELWEHWLQQALPQSHGSISMNYHATDPPITIQFFCHVLPTATTACLRAQQDLLAKKTRRDRVSKITFVEGMVYHAAHHGLFSLDSTTDTTNNKKNDTALHEALGTTGNNRTALYENLRYYIHDRLHLSHLDLPLICPTEKQLSNVLEESIRIEKQLLPRIAYAAENNMTQASHRQEFWQQVKQDKLWCTVDVERLIRGKQNWAQVLQGLEEIAAAKKQQQQLSSGSTTKNNQGP